MKKLLAIFLLTMCSCAAKPQLDPVKTAQAIEQLRLHVVEIEKKLGIVYPTPTPVAK
jgi:hypothetical protein